MKCSQCSGELIVTTGNSYCPQCETLTKQTPPKPKMENWVTASHLADEVSEKVDLALSIVIIAPKDSKERIGLSKQVAKQILAMVAKRIFDNCLNNGCTGCEETRRRLEKLFDWIK